LPQELQEYGVEISALLDKGFRTGWFGLGFWGFRLGFLGFGFSFKVSVWDVKNVEGKVRMRNSSGKNSSIFLLDLDRTLSLPSTSKTDMFV